MATPRHEVDDESEPMLERTDSTVAKEVSAAQRFEILDDQEDERYKLLDDALEHLGFGSFQYRVIVLTGFGTFVDALETNLLSILYPAFMRNKFASSYTDLAMVSSLQATGMLLGSFLLGILSDRLGRRSVYLLSLFMVVIFGLLSSFASDIVAFALWRLALGFGYGGNNNTATNLMLELMPFQKRGVGAAFHGLQWGLGSLIIASIAWIGGNDLDWRWLVRVPSIIAIPVLIAVFWLPESPRFHVHNDDNHSLSRALETIAAQNGRTIPPEADLQVLNEARDRSSRRGTTRIRERSLFIVRACSSVMRLFSSKRYFSLITPLALVWLLQGIGSTVITWLPLHSTSLSLDKTASTSVYITAFISAAGAVIASLTGFFTGPRVKRQYLVRAGLCVSIAFTFGVAFAADLSLFFTFTFFICAATQIVNGALFLYTPEVLPTNVRSTGFGLCLACFRVGPVFAPFVAAVLTDEHSFKVTSCAFGAFFLGGLLASICMNVNTVNVPLKERASSESLEKPVDLGSPEFIKIA